MPGILNSINNAIQGIANKTNGLVGGSLAQPGLGLFGTNLPGVPLISFRDRFLNSLETWNTSIPLNTQFIVLIDTFPLGLSTNILQNLEPIVHRTGFDIDLPKNTLTNFKNQAIVGCIFTNGFNIGDDTLEADSAKIENNRGFIQGTILKNRSDFASNKFTLNLRETNTSFVDFVIRPWVIMSSHFGYVARDSNNPAELIKDPKVNLTVVQYTRSDAGISQIPRKTWRFYNCVPTTVSTRDYQYDGNSESVMNFDTQWVYDRYEISSNLYLNVEQLIKAINPFPF